MIYTEYLILCFIYLGRWLLKIRKTGRCIHYDIKTPPTFFSFKIKTLNKIYSKIIVPWWLRIKKAKQNSHNILYVHCSRKCSPPPLFPREDIGSAPQVIISSRDAFSDKDYSSAKAWSVRISKWRRKYWLSFEGKKVLESVDKFIVHCWKVHCLIVRGMCHKSVANVLFIFALGIFSGKFYEFVNPKR